MFGSCSFLRGEVCQDMSSSLSARAFPLPNKSWATKALVRYNEYVALGQQVPQRKQEDWYDRLAWWSDVKSLGRLGLAVCGLQKER